MALVLVLAFIVLTTILIVSFLALVQLNRNASLSYSKSIQAQEIAQGGIQDILSDLHQEIIAGSSSSTQSGTTVYVPTTNYTAAPARFGYASNLYTNDVSSAYLPPTLIRVSRASQDGVPTDLYPPAASYYTSGLMTNRASAANTSTNSANGRLVTAARWNKIDLLTTNTTIPPPFATNTPDWVYVTRAGSRACTLADLTSSTASILPSQNLTNSSPVTGRYAYAIYDEGALLDINCAGYCSSATNNYTVLTNSLTGVPPTNSYTSPTSGVTQLTTAKSYGAYADLTQLPGITQTIVDNLVKWRNASVNLTGASGGTNYYQMVFTNATNGFLIFHSTANGTDSPLLGRADLINYMASIDPNRTSAAMATPYLGTFTRAANAPSWNPTLNAANMPGYYGLKSPNYTFVSTYADGSTAFTAIAYKDNAESTTANGKSNPNRDLPNVRYSSTQTITHYNDDGTTYTYTVNPGDPVVQHRFSLAKLAWLGTTGANAAAFNSSLSTAQQNAAILACFGLQWDGQNFTATPLHYDRWDYVAATTTNVQIETLDQIAGGSTGTANTGYREPNFFEMLKAGILAGSLGQSPGPVSGASPTNMDVEGPPAPGLDTFDVEKNRHILQIGANIIAQSRASSIPPAIYLALFGVVPPASALSNEDDLAFNTVYGDENLPSLTRWGQEVVEDWYDTTKKLGAWKTWIIPEIWNIHQLPPTSATLQNYPTQFRIRAYGKVQAENNNGGGGPGAYSTDLAGPINYDDTSTAYSYHDASSHVPPTGASATILGGQLPSVTLPTAFPYATAPPAGLIYFTDTGNATSPYYRYPDFLQWQNLYGIYSGGTVTSNSGGYVSSGPSLTKNAPGFFGTSLLNILASPNDISLTSDASPRTVNKFVAFFAGEDPNFPNLTSTTTDVQFSLNELNPYYFSIECLDPATSRWHPYSFISRISESLPDDDGTYNQNYSGTPGNAAGHATNGRTTLQALRDGCWVRPDPRTDRFSITQCRMGSATPANDTMYPGPGTTYATEAFFPWRTYGFVYNPDQGTTPNIDASGGQSQVYAWAVNLPSGPAFYVDPDGVVRPGDSYRQNASSGDGTLLYHGCASGNPYKYTSSGIGTSQVSYIPTSVASSANFDLVPVGSAQARRPVILNRPFRTVGELGYAFRDLPFKSIDFFSQYSGDAALLDLFSATDEPAISAGEVDMSNAPATTLTAILSGATKMEVNTQYNVQYDNISQYPTGVSATTGAPNFITSTEAALVGGGLASSFLQNGPLDNRADLVTRLDPLLTTISATYYDYSNKAYAEAPVRALSNVTNTRTWNLLIDIIAQSGQLSPSATSLDNFIVQGERRYWLHIAIDRYTGQIIDQQLEPVYE